MGSIVHRSPCHPFAALVASVVLSLGATPAAAQGLHKDERLGFKLKVPRGWLEVPLRSEERWIVGRYRAPKAETTVDPTSGSTLEHNPEMQIIVFLDRKTAKPVEGEGEGDEESEEEPVTIYRDYKEYMRETYGRGHFVEKEETGTQAGLAVTKIEIKAERDIDVAEMRVITRVFDTEVGDVAVQIEVMAEALKKHRAAIDDVLGSFAVIPRTLPLEVGATEAGFLSSVDLAKLTPAERKTKKIEAQRREWERMSRDLPAGWTASEIDGIYVVNHVDPTYAKKVVEQIRAVRAWLDATFPDVGPFEYARPPIVRICKDKDEETAFGSGSSYWAEGTHLVTHKGTRSETWEWEYISGRTLELWFEERDPKLWYAMPPWLDAGLDEVVSSARLQSGKLVFEMGDAEKFAREDLPRGDEDSMSLKTLLALSQDDFDAFEKREDETTWCQAVALTRYFVGARSKKTRQLLTDYMANLRVVLSELEAQEEDVGPPPQNEEEEEALFKAREEWLKSRERAILDQSMARTFPGWSAADWKNLDREFRKSL